METFKKLLQVTTFIEYVFNIYNDRSKASGCGRLTSLYLWSDNCSAQFKCRLLSVFRSPATFCFPLCMYLNFQIQHSASLFCALPDTTMVGGPNSLPLLGFYGFPSTTLLLDMGKAFVTVKAAMLNTSWPKLFSLESTLEPPENYSDTCNEIASMFPIAPLVGVCFAFAFSTFEPKYSSLVFKTCSRPKHVR